MTLNKPLTDLILGLEALTSSLESEMWTLFRQQGGHP
jgi:hypothetical protein